MPGSNFELLTVLIRILQILWYRKEVKITCLPFFYSSFKSYETETFPYRVIVFNIDIGNIYFNSWNCPSSFQLFWKSNRILCFSNSKPPKHVFRAHESFSCNQLCRTGINGSLSGFYASQSDICWLLISESPNLRADMDALWTQSSCPLHCFILPRVRYELQNSLFGTEGNEL